MCFESSDIEMYFVTSRLLTKECARSWLYSLNCLPSNRKQQIGKALRKKKWQQPSIWGTPETNSESNWRQKIASECLLLWVKSVCVEKRARIGASELQTTNRTTHYRRVNECFDWTSFSPWVCVCVCTTDFILSPSNHTMCNQIRYAEIRIHWFSLTVDSVCDTKKEPFSQ